MKSHFYLILIGFLLSQSFPSVGMGNETPSPAEKGHEKDCTYAREYITSLEYLRAHKDFAVPEAEAQKLAFKVSQGCTGAAQRFIKITTALSRAGLTGNGALETGVEFTNRSDAETQSFLSIFSSSYSEDYLDLDLQSSLRLARALMNDFHGDIPSVSIDFEKLVKFCIGERDLNLPRPQCAPFASRITRLGEKYGKDVAAGFVTIFGFLRSEAGPSLTTQQALQLSETLIEGGKTSVDNFIQAFKYGISTHGLGIPVREALQFAQKIAVQSEKID